MLKLSNIEKHYRDTTALAGVDLAISRGEVVGLFGANGAGKTTLLKAALRLTGLNAGAVTLDDTPLTETAFEKLSFITEQGSFFPNMAAGAHGEFYSAILPRFNTGRFERLLDFFEVDTTKKARNLSRGQRAKLEIVIGMSRGADFILMDEPFLGKDLFTRRDFLKLMIAMLEPHECVLIATHQLEEIEMFITRAIVLKHGKIVADAQMDDVFAECGNLAGFIQKAIGYDESRVMRAIGE